MQHVDILQKFKEVAYPISDGDIESWFPNGKGSIRIRSNTYGDLIFTYKNKKVWKIESVESYLDSIKVKEK